MLNDIKTAKKELWDATTHKVNDSMAIISTLKWDPSYVVRHQFFNHYQDYQIIYDFYESLERRDADLSKRPPDQSLLKKQNTDCFTQAQRAYTKIDWTKFYKFDLVSGIPAIIVGSLFITFVAEGIPFFLLWGHGGWQLRWQIYPYFTITSFIIRSISGFFIVGTILYATQGIRNYYLSSFSRSITFLVLSIVILGLPTMTIILIPENQRLLEVYYRPHVEKETVFDHLFRPLVDLIFSPTNTNYRVELTAMSLLFDVGRMFLLTWASWAVSKWFTTKEL